MKKFDTKYTLIGYGIEIIVILAMFLLCALTQNPIMIMAFAVVTLVVGLGTPMFYRSRLSKCATEMERLFPSNSFTYQYKFTAGNGIYYIDQGGRMGVIWKYNPKELQFVDLRTVTEIRVNNGQQLNGTSLVCCQFKVAGKKMKIYTLKVNNGQFSMKDSRVIEAIENAQDICNMLTTAQQAAAQKA